jgi:hypothetical protein
VVAGGFEAEPSVKALGTGFTVVLHFSLDVHALRGFRIAKPVW